MKTIDEIYDEYKVDKTRLKRDYINQPLKIVPRNNHGGIMKEQPFKEDVQYLYIDLNMTVEDICTVFNYLEGRMYVVLRKMGIKKDPKKVKENTAKNLLKKEGIVNVFQRNVVKEKKMNTCREKYGVNYYSSSKECRKKVVQTSLQHYGVTNPAKSDIVQQKTVNTNLEKYGAKNPTQRFYTDEQKVLLYNDDKLLEYIQSNQIVNIKDLSEKLGIRYRTMWEIINRNDWYNLFDYSKSIAEKEIRDYINQYYQTENNRKDLLGNKQEIDIYIPELKMGIEYNGNYYHNEVTKSIDYHQKKSLLAEENGIFLYHIFEYEWNNKKNQILNQLNNLLKINRNKIGARKCEIRDVTNIEKKQFLEDNHLQGDDNSSVKLGLYYKNKLVSLMTFCKPRFNKKYEWELSRFCSLAGYNVIGGASKLFKYFVENYTPMSIISYSNIAHTCGCLYKTLGFTLEKISVPNYVWFQHDEVLSRYQCQKHKLLEEGFEGKSEAEIMHNRGFLRVYDCGNKVWAWNK